MGSKDLVVSASLSVRFYVCIAMSGCFDVRSEGSNSAMGYHINEHLWQLAQSLVASRHRSDKAEETLQIKCWCASALSSRILPKTTKSSDIQASHSMLTASLEGKEKSWPSPHVGVQSTIINSLSMKKD